MLISLRFGSSAALVAASLLTLACSGAPTDARRTAPTPLTALPRQLTPAEQKVIDGSNGFAFSLLRAVNASHAADNVFVSPLSASMALGMTTNGAAGATLDAMRSTLGFTGVSTADMNASYRSVIDLLRGLDDGVDFRIANSIWYQMGFAVEQTFVDDTHRYFDAAVSARDFNDPATLVAINAWVKTNTAGKIDKIVDDLPPDLVMLLVNAIYFKGSWTQQFDKAQTIDAPFQLAGGGTKPAKLMRVTQSFPYYEDASLQAVELPYSRGAYAMTVFLPKSGADANALLAQLEGGAWDRVRTSLHPAEVALELPKFRLAWDDTLNSALKSLGMGIAFNRFYADFTRISKDGGLAISQVRQKTYVDVNEEGTEAAAATSVGVVAVSLRTGPVPMRVDRPFVFAIRERLSGTILFLGKIVAPPPAS